MKKIIVAISLAIIPIMSFAQTKEKVKELSLNSRSFNSYGFSYRVGSSKGLWRLNSFTSGLSSRRNKSERAESFNRSLSVGLGFGREYRKPISDKFEFRYGADLTFQYNHFYSEGKWLVSPLNYSENRQRSIIPGLSLVLGFNYLLTEQWIVGVEWNPGVFYEFSRFEFEGVAFDGVISKETTNARGLNYQLSNNNLVISLAYRFKKKEE
jgi:hypothetical protein